jgi:hypothetical protein
VTNVGVKHPLKALSNGILVRKTHHLSCHMAHLGPHPITIDKTFEHGIVNVVSLNFCHSIVDYISSSSYILEISGCYRHEQI